MDASKEGAYEEVMRAIPDSLARGQEGAEDHVPDVIGGILSWQMQHYQRTHHRNSGLGAQPLKPF